MRTMTDGAFKRIAWEIIAPADKELRDCKRPNQNYLGHDLDPDLVVRLSTALAPGADNTRLTEYELAQLHELSFWRWVAFEGYNCAAPRTFPWSQRVHYGNVPQDGLAAGRFARPPSKSAVDRWA